MATITYGMISRVMSSLTFTSTVSIEQLEYLQFALCCYVGIYYKHCNISIVAIK